MKQISPCDRYLTGRFVHLRISYQIPIQAFLQKHYKPFPYKGVSFARFIRLYFQEPSSKFNAPAIDEAILSLSTTAEITASRICLKARTIISWIQSDWTCESFSESLACEEKQRTNIIQHEKAYIHNITFYRICGR